MPKFTIKTSHPLGIEPHHWIDHEVVFGGRMMLAERFIVPILVNGDDHFDAAQKRAELLGPSQMSNKIGIMSVRTWGNAFEMPHYFLWEQKMPDVFVREIDDGFWIEGIQDA